MKIHPSTAFLLLVLMIWGNIGLQAQISPGDLAEPHAHLEGMTNCTLCHVLGDKVSNALCLDCHQELKVRIDNNQGYHVSEEVKSKECAECHNDHHGRNFRIVNFDTEKFDHQLAGYSLEGAHTKVNCEDCHKSKNIIDPKILEKKYTYLGLRTECLACHDDYHQNSLDVDCMKCHDFEVFKPAKKFNHDKSNFILKGQHKKVDCIDCHKVETRNEASFQLFKPVQHDNCTACHRDVHENKFGQDCRRCHNEESFQQITNTDLFNHNLTGYPLTGLHRQVDCKQCHKKNLTAALPHQYCIDCHQDQHEGDFTEANQTRDCVECHTTSGFTPSLFGFEQHANTTFPLEGAHLATPCFACHQKPDRLRFKSIGSTCNDCHDNIHEGYISPSYYPENNCKTCHNAERWSTVNFDHSRTQFELTGKHLIQDCRACHFDPKNNNQQEFAGLKTSCVRCHTDAHAGQFEANNENDCARCHNTNLWKPLLFDHSKTQFPLDGAHANVACSGCHKQTILNNQSVLLYKIPDFTCEACHK